MRLVTVIFKIVFTTYIAIHRVIFHKSKRFGLKIMFTVLFVDVKGKIRNEYNEQYKCHQLFRKKAEIKNLHSFWAIQKQIKYQIALSSYNVHNGNYLCSSS